MPSAMQSWWVRLGVWTLSGLVAFWAVVAGVVIFVVGTPATDLDGFAVSMESRVFLGGFGVVIGLVGVALSALSVVRVVRIARSHLPVSKA